MGSIHDQGHHKDLSGNIKEKNGTCRVAYVLDFWYIKVYPDNIQLYNKQI